MKTFVLLSVLTANVAALSPSQLSVVVPSRRPTVASDDWGCAIETYTPFFKYPKPTGAVLSALYSYGDELQSDCTGLSPYPDATRWCGITTVLPTAVLPAYTSYASSASVWWASQSSSAIALAERCPDHWYDASIDMPTNGIWLNQTIINAECFAGAAKAGSSPVKVASPSATPSPTTVASSALISSPKLSAPLSTSSSVATSGASANDILLDGKGLLFWILVSVTSLLSEF